MVHRSRPRGLFRRILNSFRSSCGADDDAWADLSPWELCANSCGEQPPPDIPQVVSIAEEESDMISGLHTINQTRGPTEQTPSIDSEFEPSEVFAIKRRRKKRELKQKRRDSPPSHEHDRIPSGLLPPQYVERSRPLSPLTEIHAEQSKKVEKVIDDIPRNIYTRARVQHHIVRL